MLINRLPIITFVGTVGSGKSTHMKLLYFELRRRGLKTKMCFLKRGYLASILEIFLTKVLACRRRNIYAARVLVEEKPQIFRRLFKLWLTLDLISIIIKFLVGIYLPLKLGYIILVEEYIPATISDYIYLSKILKSPLETISFTIKCLLKLMNLCNPIQTIFLDAKDDDLLFRWRFRGSPNEVEDYLKMQRTILFHLSKELSHRFLNVNTSAKTINEAHRLITNYIFRIYSTQ